MNHAAPVVLATIPGSKSTDRLQLVMVPSPEGGTHVELRQQSYAEALGWYTQSSVAIEPEQVADLRNSLGMGGRGGRLRVESTPTDPNRPLRIVG